MGKGSHMSNAYLGKGRYCTYEQCLPFPMLIAILEKGRHCSYVRKCSHKESLHLFVMIFYFPLKLNIEFCFKFACTAFEHRSCRKYADCHKIANGLGFTFFDGGYQEL